MSFSILRLKATKNINESKEFKTCSPGDRKYTNLDEYKCQRKYVHFRLFKNHSNDLKRPQFTLLLHNTKDSLVSHWPNLFLVDFLPEVEVYVLSASIVWRFL